MDMEEVSNDRLRMRNKNVKFGPEMEATDHCQVQRG